jgi:hypothetical protein
VSGHQTRSRVLRRNPTLLILTALFLAVAAPAFADPAGPTDFQNEVIRVDPPTTGVTFSIVGGDAFLRAVVEPGSELVVVGYFGEDYLRILPDGRVEENRNSPSVALNVDRYGEDVDYDRADADLAPDWATIGEGGVWAWHDHRTHWMSKTPPPGRAPGDVVYDEVAVPVVVNGTATLLWVSLTWLERGAPIWAIAGAALGLLMVGAGSRFRFWALGLLAAASLSVGFWQYLWLPAETAPSPLQWAVPGVALLFLGIALRRPNVRGMALAVAAAELAGWAIWRRESMWRAILPTGAPYGLDRAVTAAALAGGLLGVFLWAVELRRARPAPERGAHV